MNKRKKETRQKIKSIKTISEYRDYTNDLKMTELERIVMDMIYVDGYDLGYIADTLGYSRARISQISQRILDKFI